VGVEYIKALNCRKGVCLQRGAKRRCEGGLDAFRIFVVVLAPVFGFDGFNVHGYACTTSFGEELGVEIESHCV